MVVSCSEERRGCPWLKEENCGRFGVQGNNSAMGSLNFELAGLLGVHLLEPVLDGGVLGFIVFYAWVFR